MVRTVELAGLAPDSVRDLCQKNKEESNRENTQDLPLAATGTYHTQALDTHIHTNFTRYADTKICLKI